MDDISKWTIPQLKFWLKCRRLNQQGLKKRPRRKVSFVILLSQADAAHRNILCFQCCFQCLFVCFFFFRVKAIKSIPYYRNGVYDLDPERSYTKTKLEKLKRPNATVESAVKQTSPDNSPFDSFLSDECTQFSEDFSILPSFVPMDAFEQLKILVNQLRNKQCRG